MKLERPSGSDVAQIRITGNPKNCEPAHVRILFPGGHMEVTRATDGEGADYWVHVWVNFKEHSSFIPEETIEGEIIDSRHDSLKGGALSLPLRKDAYHVAVRVRQKT
jgi:hypothetical protein